MPKKKYENWKWIYKRRLEKYEKSVKNDG